MAKQLDLWEVELHALPWRGVSPRELTRGRKALFLAQEAQKGDRFFVDPNQLDLFKRRGPELPKYSGAPLLWEVGHGKR